MSTIRIKGDTSGYIDLSAGSNDGALDISSSVTGAPVRTHSDLELETGGIHVKNPAGIEGLIVDGDTTNAGVSGRIVLKNSTDASSVYYSNTLGWTFHTGTILGTTSGTQRMFITPQGYQRLPYQPAFEVNITTNTNVPTSTTKINFNNISVNTGNHYDGTNDRFVAPVTGKYFISWCVNAYSGNVESRYIAARLYKNGAEHRTVHGQMAAASGSSDYAAAPGSIVVHLNVNDYLEVFVDTASSGLAMTGNNTNFTGFLIG
jgi:hypothetical protein